MRQVNFEPIMIFSVFKNGGNFLDETDHESIVGLLRERGVKFQQCNGVYKGVKEKSFLVSAKHRDLILEIAKQYKQESVMYSGPDRFSFLEFLKPGGGTLPIGTLKQVSKVEAVNYDAYTEIDGTYYITK